MVTTGEKLQVKNKGWYEQFKGTDNKIHSDKTIFLEEMSEYCGKILTVDRVFNDGLFSVLEVKGLAWAEWMFESKISEFPKEMYVWNSFKENAVKKPVLNFLAGLNKPYLTTVNDAISFKDTVPEYIQCKFYKNAMDVEAFEEKRNPRIVYVNNGDDGKYEYDMRYVISVDLDRERCVTHGNQNIKSLNGRSIWKKWRFENPFENLAIKYEPRTRIFEIGDSVYHFHYGWGIVIDVKSTHIDVKFNDGSFVKCHHNKEKGRRFFSALSYDFYTLEGGGKTIEFKHAKPRKGQLVYVKSSSTLQMWIPALFYGMSDNNKPLCFTNTRMSNIQEFDNITTENPLL